MDGNYFVYPPWLHMTLPTHCLLCFKKYDFIHMQSPKQRTFKKYDFTYLWPLNIDRVRRGGGQVVMQCSFAVKSYVKCNHSHFISHGLKRQRLHKSPRKVTMNADILVWIDTKACWSSFGCPQVSWDGQRRKLMQASNAVFISVISQYAICFLNATTVYSEEYQYSLLLNRANFYCTFLVSRPARLVGRTGRWDHHATALLSTCRSTLSQVYDARQETKLSWTF